MPYSTRNEHKLPYAKEIERDWIYKEESLYLDKLFDENEK